MPKIPTTKLPKVGTKTAKGTTITQGHINAMQSDQVTIQVLEDNTAMVLAELPKAEARALEAIGLLAEGHVIGYITAEHIVDTGRLRNSITHAVDGDDLTVIVGTNVEYAPYVHEGVHGKPGRPFLTKPIESHTDEYRQVFEEQMKGSGSDA